MKPDKVKLKLSPENRSLFAKRQNENRDNPTPSEKRIITMLDEMGERYIFEKGIFTETRFFLVDFYFPAPRRVCLEIDGPCHEFSMGYDFVRDCYIMRTRRIKKILRITTDTAMKIAESELLELIN